MYIFIQVQRTPREFGRPLQPESSVSVSIKYGLRTADYGLRIGYKRRTRCKTLTGKYGLGIKHRLGIKRELRTTDCGLGIIYGLRTTLVKSLFIGSRYGKIRSKDR